MITRTDRKRAARIEIICDLLSRFEFTGKDNALISPNRNIVLPFKQMLLDDGWLVR
jgi:hypothetical protein